MQEFLNNFSQGKGTPADIDALESLAKALVDGSLCGLGRTAPNPVLTSIRYFRDEYLAHIVDHHCPAGVCRDLITYRIDPETCNGCSLCAKNCPQACITGENKKPHTIDQDACIRCGVCMDVCPVDCRGRGLGGEVHERQENPVNEVHQLHHRRPAGPGQTRLDHPGDGPALPHPYPHPVLPPGGHPLGQLPVVRG